MIAKEINGFDDDKADTLIAECREISRMLHGLRKSLSSNKDTFASTQPKQTSN